jgi:hypothetical protein
MSKRVKRDNFAVTHAYKHTFASYENNTTPTELLLPLTLPLPVIQIYLKYDVRLITYKSILHGTGYYLKS